MHGNDSQLYHREAGGSLPARSGAGRTRRG